MDHSIVFVNSPERINPKSTGSFKQLFLVSPNDLIFRIFAAFVPPWSKKYQQVNVDLLGPILAFLTLTAFVHYGHTAKISKISHSPTEVMCLFVIVMPILCYLSSKLGWSAIKLSETVSLVGYSLYGHFFTLLISFLCFQERSNFFFFVCLVIFGGLSTLRLTLVILGTIPTPGARLLICTVISTTNILFLVFLHFAFMHKTYYYQGTN